MGNTKEGKPEAMNHILRAHRPQVYKKRISPKFLHLSSTETSPVEEMKRIRGDEKQYGSMNMYEKTREACRIPRLYRCKMDVHETRAAIRQQEAIEAR